ncbi:MAG TPA: penicillin-binding protein, partial [candidate division WWE3 bacterium]|nr:penicillin-binding protein [candidate division WWE3 bacterium]
MKKIPAPIRRVLEGIFSLVRTLVTPVFNLLFGLISKLPLFKKLQKRGKKGLFYWLNVGATVFLMLIIFASAVAGATFIVFSKDLPSPDRLVDREVSMSTKIYDRNGKLLYDIYGDENRTLINIDEVPDVVKQATISIEDKNFYRHRGFDPFGMARGIYNTVVKNELQGGSSITQQLVKNTLLTAERTITRKIKEFVLALQIEARYSKDEILQMYFNETPYGGQAIGIQAAAENYFGKSASELTLEEASLLAGLPQAPSRYSPYRDPELARWRQGEVLRRMREDGYITREQEEEVKNTKLKFKPEGSQIRAPHFVMYVKELLAERYGETFVETGGLRVTTSLDLTLHNKFQKYVTDEVKQDRIWRVSNGALVATNPRTGEILSMVGSKDYFDDAIDGQFNVTTSPSRQPGSSIKPITYVTAFKQGFSPATRLIGVPTTFDAGAGQPKYKPQNFANQNYRIVSVRRAIGNSLNIPAVKMLSLVGVNNMLDTAEDMGITTLT